jgi:hypothetical protein
MNCDSQGAPVTATSTGTGVMDVHRPPPGQGRSAPIGPP